MSCSVCLGVCYFTALGHFLMTCAYEEFYCYFLCIENNGLLHAKKVSLYYTTVTSFSFLL